MEKRHTISEFTDLLAENGLISDMSIGSSGEKTIEYISFSSADMRNNTLFVCKGKHFEEKYLADALARGAVIYVSEKKYEAGDGAPYIIVNDMRRAMALIANLFYNDVWKKLNIIGITGTKGKSTTTYFMRYILDDFMKAEKKPRSAVISSIDTYDGVINEESHLTTPEAFMIHKHYHNAVESGIEYLTMEVSSQALKYHRVMGITFDVACFLNIGQDHISDVEHTDFDDYFNSKLKIFSQCKTAVVNLNADRAETILAEAKKGAEKVITFGLMPEADVFGYDIITDSDGIAFKARTPKFDEEFKIGIRGLFNVQNALAAIAMCTALDVPVEYIKSGLLKARADGRMEIYTARKKDLSVIVDYAHNKMSMEALFESTQKEFPGKRISIVFGCPGNKAYGRRRELGEIAGRYSDAIYLTEEDPGEESVVDICNEIAKYVEKEHANYKIIPDRREAIREAIKNAGDNAVVLVTAKGRETRQKRGTEYIEVASDVDMVQEFLKDE